MKSEIQKKYDWKGCDIMEVSFLNDYFEPVTVGICLCIGYVVKRWIKDVDNKFIPTIVAVIGILVAIWTHRAISPSIVLRGLFSGLASTGLHQLFTRLIRRKNV